MGIIWFECTGKERKKNKSFGGLAWLRKLITGACLLLVLWLVYEYTMGEVKNGEKKDLVKDAGTFFDKLQRAIHSSKWE
jgi:hypothetical protein